MKRALLFFTFIFFAIYSSLAQEIPARPDPPRLVNDFASLLSNEEQSNLEQTLDEFARTTSTQIVVVIVKSLQGSEISDYAFNLGEKWGVGQKDKNNGVVIILQPKTLGEKGQVFIATGYGIEHLIPDAVANNQIVGNEMIPRFKQNDYYGGLVAGTNVIMALTRGEYTADAYKAKVKSKSGGRGFFFLIILFFVIIPFLRGRNRGHFSSGGSLPFWIAMGMLGSNRSSHSGTFGNFSSGGGGFGGFGGFGGGSFGGGGAGGSW
jgi:uncharacterized protein